MAEKERSVVPRDGILRERPAETVSSGAEQRYANLLYTSRGKAGMGCGPPISNER